MGDGDGRPRPAQTLRAELARAYGKVEAALRQQEDALHRHCAMLRQMNSYARALGRMVSGSELVQVGAAIKERLAEARDVDVDVQPVAVQERFPRLYGLADAMDGSLVLIGRVVEQAITPWCPVPTRGQPKAIYVMGGSDGKKHCSSVL